MRKFILLFVMLIGSLSLFAQNMDPGPDYSAGFETFAALVALIPFAVEAVKKLIPNASSTAIQIVSWVAGIVVTMFAWMFHLGFVAGLEWYIALLYGLGASLAANGIFDTGLISWILKLFGKRDVIKLE